MARRTTLPPRDACRMRNILTTNVFVRHYGGASFGESKLARVCKAIEMVEALHPLFNGSREFIRATRFGRAEKLSTRPSRPPGRAAEQFCL